MTGDIVHSNRLDALSDKHFGRQLNNGLTLHTHLLTGTAAKVDKKTKKTTNKESKTITSNAGCGVSVQRNPKNKTYKYTLTAKVSPYPEKDADPFSNKTLVATATQY